MLLLMTYFLFYIYINCISTIDDCLHLLQAEPLIFTSTVYPPCDDCLHLLQAEPLDEVSLKKLLLQFEKRLYRNQELRIKFPDMPEKYVFCCGFGISLCRAHQPLPHCCCCFISNSVKIFMMMMMTTMTMMVIILLILTSRVLSMVAMNQTLGRQVGQEMMTPR